ncbi:MAG: ester cyclase, partial [Anaerolineae bacterium]
MRFNRLVTAVVILLVTLILGACQPATPTPAPTPVPVTEENKAVVRRLYDELWNQGNLAIVDELVAADFVDHNPDPGQPPGPEGWKQSATVSRAGFPDLQVTIEDMVAEGDRVTLRLKGSGTHTGEFAGIPPTGNQFSAGWVDVVRVEDGKIAERWGQFDALGFLTQLG